MSKRKRAAVKIAALIIVFALFNSSISDAAAEHGFARDSADAGVFVAYSGHYNTVADDEDDDVLDYIAEDEDEDYDEDYFLADDVGGYDALFEIVRREVSPIGAGGYFSPNFTLAGQSFNGGSIFGQGFGVGLLGGVFPAQASGGFGANSLGTGNLTLGVNNVGAFGQSFITGEASDEDGSFGGGDVLANEDLTAADSGDDEDDSGAGGNGDENNNAAQDGGGDDSDSDDDVSDDGAGGGAVGDSNGSPSDIDSGEDAPDDDGVMSPDDADDANGGGNSEDDDDDDDSTDSAAAANTNPDDPDEADEPDESEGSIAQQNTPNPFTGDNHSTRSLIISALGFVISSGILFFIYFHREQPVN